jgi:hypothetical protein
VGQGQASTERIATKFATNADRGHNARVFRRFAHPEPQTAADCDMLRNRGNPTRKETF